MERGITPCVEALSHWPEMKNSGSCSSWSFTKRYCTYMCHTLCVYRPPKVPYQPLSQTFLRIPQQYFVSFSYPKNKPTQSVTVALTLWIHCTADNWVAFWCGVIARKGVYAVISRSFSRSVDVVVWPVQRRFVHCGEFQKLLNDRGEMISNLGYLTSFPHNLKQQCRNHIHHW